MTIALFSRASLILSTFIASTLYTHFRGKVRHKFFRQLTDHSTFMAPINLFMYLFSAIPNTVYINLEQFPELQVLRDNWLIIKKEAEKLYQEGYIAASDHYDDAGFNSFFRRGWKRFYLKWYDQALPSAKNLCPETLKLIENIPSINAAMFTLLPSGSKLVRHRDPYAGSLRYHLGIMTPNSEKCYINVDGESYFWRDGEVIMFDETFIHYAENATNQDRIIFFCDIARPMRNRLATAINRWFSRYIMSASATKNLPGDKIGFINKVFKYLYQIRLLGKKLKAYNKTLYYLVKYLLFAGLIYLLFL